MYNNQYKKCYYCKITMNTDIGDKICNQISIDRKDSNLAYTKDNCVLTCLFCNLAKNNTNIQHFKIFLDSIKKMILIIKIFLMIIVGLKKFIIKLVKDIKSLI